MRLTTAVRPTDYKLILNSISAENKFYGRILISAIITQKRKSFKLNANNIVIHKLEVFHQNTQLHTRIKIGEDFIYLNFVNLIPKEIIIDIIYEGIITDDLKGLYRNTFTDKDHHEVLCTQFEPTFARRVFPCFDEPSFKASFSLALIVDKHLSAFSNMPEKSRKAYNNVKDYVVFHSTPLMSTYTFAFVIGEYKLLSHNTISILFPTFQTSISSEFALQVAKASITQYEKVLGIKYNLPKLDLIAVPESEAGAMENWGLVTFEPQALFTYPISSEDDKYYVASTVAHELSHQFFGNIDTTGWWNTLWLNEGIATFFEYVGVDATFPDWHVWDTFIFRCQQVALEIDALRSSHPLNNQAFTEDEIEEMFDDITYSKGGSILYMVADIVGNRTLFTGLHKYLTHHEFQTVTPDMLWKSIGDDLSRVMRPWTDWSGFPLITVTESEDGIQLSQERYLPYNNKHNEKDKLWWISTVVKCSDGTETRITFEDRISKSIPLDTTWYKVNYNQATFARVNYPISHWKKIIQPHLTPQDRAGLLSDALTLSLDGKLPIEVSLEITQKVLSYEKDYVVWMSALGPLYDLAYLFIGHHHWIHFRKYVVSLLEKIHDWIWADPKTHLHRLLIPELLSAGVFFDEPGVSHKLKELFLSWKKNQSSVPSNLLKNILENAVANMGNEVYDLLYKKFLTETNPVQRRNYLFALTTTPDTKNLKHLLKISLDTSLVEMSDRVSVILGVAENPVGRQLAWTFVKKHWSNLNYRGQSIINLIEGITMDFHTHKDYHDVEQFFDTHHTVAKLAVKRSLERILHNISWREQSIDQTYRWLKKL